MMSTMSENMLIDAYPTKELFIEMLVRDIKLVPAIIDLIDNSVDGARRLRPDGKYDGLSVRIEINADSFVISDNCGGIPEDIARKYAFRFGRPKEMKPTKHSVGQFGIGMKRSLFKLGTEFEVESATSDAHFKVAIDVESWKSNQEWNFVFDFLEKDPNNIPAEKVGTTTIRVNRLNEDYTLGFDHSYFVKQLITEVTGKHRDSLNSGLAITINQIPLTHQPTQLLVSDELKPAYREERLSNGVNVKMYSGIAHSSPKEAGWYIFCNGRLILEADKSSITCWGEGDGKVIPNFHNQFARFRGYIYFDSDNAGLLPWNTTKTSVDEDSRIFRHVRPSMLEIMRPVIDFLNKLDSEKKEEEEDNQVLDAAVKAAKTVSIGSIIPTKSFVAPTPKPIKKQPTTGKISFSKPLSEIQLVKEHLGVSTNKEVGEKTFEYFIKWELDDNG